MGTIMRLTRQGRFRAAALVAAVVAGLLGWPGAASAAEVTITTSPVEVHQGDAVEVAVVLPEERTGSRTSRIELRMPADAPVGEVYPLSVPGWAPRITTRSLDRPVAGIHATGVDLVTDAVSWSRAPGTGGGPTRLALAMGPLPRTDRLAFQVVQTYSDGTVLRWADPVGGAHPAPALTLLPPTSGTATGGHGGHGGEQADGAAVDAPAAPRAASVAAPVAGDDADPPDPDLLVGGGLLAGLAGGAAMGWLLSRRRRGELALRADEHEDDGRLADGRDAGGPADSDTPPPARRGVAG